MIYIDHEFIDFDMNESIDNFIMMHFAYYEKWIKLYNDQRG